MTTRVPPVWRGIVRVEIVLRSATREIPPRLYRSKDEAREMRAGVPCNSHEKIVYTQWPLTVVALLVYDDISHRAFRSLRDQLTISLSLSLMNAYTYRNCSLKSQKSEASKYNAIYKCRLDSKTRDETRENNPGSQSFTTVRILRISCRFHLLTKFSLRRCTASRLSRTCPFKGASTHASEGHEGKTRGCARRCDSELAINRSTALFPLNPEKLRGFGTGSGAATRFQRCVL